MFGARGWQASAFRVDRESGSVKSKCVDNGLILLMENKVCKDYKTSK